MEINREGKLKRDGPGSPRSWWWDGAWGSGPVGRGLHKPKSILFPHLVNGREEDGMGMGFTGNMGSPHQGDYKVDMASQSSSVWVVEMDP